MHDIDRPIEVGRTQDVRLIKDNTNPVARDELLSKRFRYLTYSRHWPPSRILRILFRRLAMNAEGPIIAATISLYHPLQSLIKFHTLNLWVWLLSLSSSFMS